MAPKRSNWERPPGKQDARTSKTRHVFHVAILHGRVFFEKLALLAFLQGKREGGSVIFFLSTRSLFSRQGKPVMENMPV